MWRGVLLCDILYLIEAKGAMTLARRRSGTRHGSAVLLLCGLFFFYFSHVALAGRAIDFHGAGKAHKEAAGQAAKIARMRSSSQEIRVGILLGQERQGVGDDRSGWRHQTGRGLGRNPSRRQTDSRHVLPSCATAFRWNLPTRQQALPRQSSLARA